MNLKPNQIYKDNSGQTAVEYVMLLGAMMVLMVSLTGAIRGRMLPPGGQCSPGSQNLFCQFEEIVSPTSLRYFRLRR